MKRLLLVLAIICAIAMLALLFIIPERAVRIYGPADPSMGTADKLQYAVIMLWHDGLLTRPLNPQGGEVAFTISSGESVGEIAGRLEESGLIASAAAFRDYLVYSGLDKTIQSGIFQLSPALSPLTIADEIQDGTPDQVVFTVLAGWRMEEVAASLPTSGLDIQPEEFLAAAKAPRTDLDYIPPGRYDGRLPFPDAVYFSERYSGGRTRQDFGPKLRSLHDSRVKARIRKSRIVHLRGCYPGFHHRAGSCCGR